MAQNTFAFKKFKMNERVLNKFNASDHLTEGKYSFSEAARAD